MDVLSNVLNVTNLATRVLGSRELLAPWGVCFEREGHAVMHIVKRGSAWLRQDDTLLPLQAGDIVLLATDEAHTLASERETRELEPFGASDGRAQERLVATRGEGNGAEATIVQSAVFEFSHDTAHPLLSLLPRVVHLSAERIASDAELQALLRLIGNETAKREPGNELVVLRLIDTLLVYSLRAWLRDQPEGSAGWLGALRDPQIRKALTQIHEAPQAPWTVESLARSVAMSRAAFAKRFADIVGEPPLAYVTRWRMDLAAKLLRESREPVARIAGRVGYLSETAFAKAFRRRRHVAPGQYRYRRTHARTEAAASAQA